MPWPSATPPMMGRSVAVPYMPYDSTEELLSSLGHIDPTATLSQQTPRQRAIEECKRLNWWRECEKKKPAGVEDLSSEAWMYLALLSALSIERAII
jgi:hypothetical protein